MLHLGIQYGITGNGLKKICDRWKVPYRAAMQVFDHWIILGTLVDRVLSRRCGKPDMRINLTRRTALIGLSVALPVRAQPTLDAVEPVSLEQPAIFEITPITGTLRKRCRKDSNSSGRGEEVRMIVDFKSPIFPPRSSVMSRAGGVRPPDGVAKP
jgi:hypothetical protein